MNYVPGYAKIMCGVLVYIGIIGVMKFIKNVDADIQKCNSLEMNRLVTGIGILSCIMVTMVQYAGSFSVMETMCIVLLGIYLGTAAVMDMLLCMVSDFLQYIGLAAGILWILVKEPLPERGTGLIIFAFLQYFLFMRMYGQADGMAFCICALFWTGLNLDMEMCLFHMEWCVILLAVVQLIRGNIARKGNLKKPVAMFPYITASFWSIFLQIFG